MISKAMVAVAMASLFLLRLFSGLEREVILML
jgi:hypothetical protein